MSGLNAGADVSESGDSSLGTVTGAVTVGPSLLVESRASRLSQKSR
jgi:hypothetical protein